jgi:hypothetical protein
MEKAIYSNNGGLGIILDSEENEIDFFAATTLQVGTETLKPQDLTTLFGLFSEPVRYAGTLKNESENLTVMCFYLGDSDGNLFEQPKKYYSCFYWVSENRIANKYSTGNNCRDFHFKNGQFK